LSLNLEEKKAVVAEVAAQVAAAQTVVVAEYRGIKVEDLTQLRAQARKEGVYLRVLKNTLVRRAIADTPFAGIADQLVGPLAYGVSKDPVAAAKVMHEFAKTNDKFVIKAGAMPNAVISAKEVAALASLGGASHANVVGWLASPISSALAVLLVVTAAYHALLGLQVVLEDYVADHGKRLAALLFVKFALVVAAVIGVLAVLRIAFGAAA